MDDVLRQHYNPAAGRQLIDLYRWIFDRRTFYANQDSEGDKSGPPVDANWPRSRMQSIYPHTPFLLFDISISQISRHDPWKIPESGNFLACIDCHILRHVMMFDDSQLDPSMKRRHGVLECRHGGRKEQHVNRWIGVDWNVDNGWRFLWTGRVPQKFKLTKFTKNKRQRRRLLLCQDHARPPTPLSRRSKHGLV